MNKMGTSTSITSHITSKQCIKKITRYFADHLIQTKCRPNSSFSTHSLTDTKWRYKKSDSFTPSTTTTTSSVRKLATNAWTTQNLTEPPVSHSELIVNKMGPPTSQNFSHYIQARPRNLSIPTDHLTQIKCCSESSFGTHNLTDTKWRCKKNDNLISH